MCHLHCINVFCCTAAGGTAPHADVDEDEVSKLMAMVQQLDPQLEKLLTDSGDADTAALTSLLETINNSLNATAPQNVAAAVAAYDKELAQLLEDDPELEELLNEKDIVDFDALFGGDDEVDDDVAGLDLDEDGDLGAASSGDADLDKVSSVWDVPGMDDDNDDDHLGDEDDNDGDNDDEDQEEYTIEQLLEAAEEDPALTAEQKLELRMSIQGMYNTQPGQGAATASKGKKQAGDVSGSRQLQGPRVTTTTGWGEAAFSGGAGDDIEPPPLLTKPVRRVGGSHKQ